MPSSAIINISVIDRLSFDSAIETELLPFLFGQRWVSIIVEFANFLNVE